jgi:anti-sigma B factor antagonist
MAFGCGQVLTSHGVATAAARPDVPMRLSCQVSASHAEVALRGELDLATADLVVSYVSDVIDRYDGPVVADLHDIAFCDACGLGALVRIVSYAERAGRPLELARPSRSVSKIMRITGVDDRLLAPSPARSRG